MVLNYFSDNNIQLFRHMKKISLGGGLSYLIFYRLGGVYHAHRTIPLLSPDLLRTLAAMGRRGRDRNRGRNFPADFDGQALSIRADGHGANELLDAILQVLPLDEFVDAPVTLMEVVPGSLPAAIRRSGASSKRRWTNMGRT
jgi:hypothetical protein